MQQMFQQPEPPKKSFMEQVGWQLIILIGTLIATLLAALILGSTHIIDFSVFMLVLVVIMFCIMIFCIWYTFRSRQKLQEQYNKDIADFKRDILVFKNDIRLMRENETRQLNEWMISIPQTIDQAQKQRTDKIRQDCLEAIHDAEQRLDSNMKNAMSLYKQAQETAGIIIDQYREQLIHEMKRLDAIEEHFKNMTPPDKVQE